MGIYFNYENNWLYHTELQWVYPVLSSGNSLWLYLPKFGRWVWTREGIFPFVYYGSSQKWVYIDRSDVSISFYLLDRILMGQMVKSGTVDIHSNSQQLILDHSPFSLSVPFEMKKKAKVPNLIISLKRRILLLKN